MITFSKLEKKGHLGNQLFQIASTIGIAKSNGQEFGFPKWSYNFYFQNELPVEKLENFEVYKEETFHFTAKKFDHKNLNLDTVEFKNLNPSAENIVVVIYTILRAKIESGFDLQIRLYETERNFVEYPAI